MNTVQKIWLGACLVFFGAVIGVLTALNQQAGSATTLIATLVTLIGGSLASLYRPKDLPPEAGGWIVQAIGLVSIGILMGLLGGFSLRYYDQAHLMTGIAKERAALDRDLRQHGQCLADYWGESLAKCEKGKGGADKERTSPGGPASSVVLREGIEELSRAALKELSGAILRIDNKIDDKKEDDTNRERLKQLKARVIKYRSVIEKPKEHSATDWLANVDLATEAMAGSHEDSAETLLRQLRQQAVKTFSQ